MFIKENRIRSIVRRILLEKALSDEDAAQLADKGDAEVPDVYTDAEREEIFEAFGDINWKKSSKQCRFSSKLLESAHKYASLMAAKDSSFDYDGRLNRIARDLDKAANASRVLYKYEWQNMSSSLVDDEEISTFFSQARRFVNYTRRAMKAYKNLRDTFVKIQMQLVGKKAPSWSEPSALNYVDQALLGPEVGNLPQAVEQTQRKILPLDKTRKTSGGKSRSGSSGKKGKDAKSPKGASLLKTVPYGDTQAASRFRAWVNKNFKTLANAKRRTKVDLFGKKVAGLDLDPDVKYPAMTNNSYMRAAWKLLGDYYLDPSKIPSGSEAAKGEDTDGDGFIDDVYSRQSP